LAAEEALVDPAVSRAKFDREIRGYREQQDHQHRRGVWLVKAEYPEAFVVFGTPQLKPPAIVFGASLDFTNYDLWPPSVRLVDPFTGVPYKAGELPTVLSRLVPASSEMLEQGIPAGSAVPQALMQSHSPEDAPFLCLPGVREYHEHPAHSGDSWMLHRKGPEGTLHFLLEQLYKYGVAPINTYNVGMQIAVSGFGQGTPPA
jgi:hypothetical protein